MQMFIIGLSVELAKVPHLAVYKHFLMSAALADEPACMFDKHLYSNWLWLCGFVDLQRAVGAYGGWKACDFIGW